MQFLCLEYSLFASFYGHQLSINFAHIIHAHLKKKLNLTPNEINQSIKNNHQGALAVVQFYIHPR
jgi:hypothetical protein